MYELNVDVNQEPISILPGVNVDPITVPIIPTGLSVFPQQEPVVQANYSHLEVQSVTAQTVPLPSDDLSNAEKCELEAAMQNRLTEQQNVVTTTTQETNEQLNSASKSMTPLVPISWEVGTRLVYVTFDQIQGEIMEMDEYLKRYKNKDISRGNQDKEYSKGSYQLDFLSAAGGAGDTNAEGRNANNDTDSTESYDVPPINNDIKQQVDELFKQSVRSNKCFLPVERLTDDIICAHQPSRRPPSIDPYSSLEDICSGENNTTPTSDSDKNKDTNEQKMCYYMWTRKSKTIGQCKTFMGKSLTGLIMRTYSRVTVNRTEVGLSQKRKPNLYPLLHQMTELQLKVLKVTLLKDVTPYLF